MSGSRIVFTHFSNPNSMKLSSWRDHARAVVGQLGSPVASSDEAVIWQLMSSNNRELGRSAVILGSYADAHAHAANVVAAAPQLVVESVSHERAGMHGWFLRDGIEPVVVCARWFAAPRERKYSSALALASLGEVELGQGARQYIEQTPTGSVAVPDRRTRHRLHVV